MDISINFTFAVLFIYSAIFTSSGTVGSNDFLTSIHDRYKNDHDEVANATDNMVDSDDFVNTIKERVEDDVKFMLFTRKNPMHYNMIYWEKRDNITTSHFDPKKITKVLIHGWLNSQKTAFPKHVKDAYLTRYDANVIVIDWRPMSLWLYSSARMAVPYVSDHVANFLEVLVRSGVDPSRLHIVGHSLGAHLAGIAGHKANCTVGRITWLDPASPLFSFDEVERLNERSAAFVDVIHTCGLLLGFFSAIGHVDFYPNGGRPIQPGCGVDLDGECSHRRAHEYFAESIVTRGGFVGTACDKWDKYTSKKCTPPRYAEMGEDVPHTARGVYYLTTLGEEPYAMGRVGLV